MMHRILGIIAAIAAVIGFLFMLSMFWGAANNGGMAVLGLQIFGVLVSVAASIIGGIALFLGRPTPSGFSEFGSGLGLGNLLALLIAYLIF